MSCGNCRKNLCSGQRNSLHPQRAEELHPWPSASDSARLQLWSSGQDAGTAMGSRVPSHVSSAARAGAAVGFRAAGSASPVTKCGFVSVSCQVLWHTRPTLIAVFPSRSHHTPADLAGDGTFVPATHSGFSCLFLWKEITPFPQIHLCQCPGLRQDFCRIRPPSDTSGRSGRWKRETRYQLPEMRKRSRFPWK